MRICCCNQIDGQQHKKSDVQPGHDIARHSRLLQAESARMARHRRSSQGLGLYSVRYRGPLERGTRIHTRPDCCCPMGSSDRPGGWHRGARLCTAGTAIVRFPAPDGNLRPDRPCPQSRPRPGSATRQSPCWRGARRPFRRKLCGQPGSPACAYRPGCWPGCPA